MSPKGKVDSFLMAVLSRRFDAIAAEMTNTLLRTGRSGVLAMARDFSCSICDSSGNLVVTGGGIPHHVATMDMVAKASLKVHGHDWRDGDCIINNYSWLGNTHHADMTLTVPVFHGGELMYIAVSRAHHADTGAPEPSTYLPYAATVQQEGLHFPCIFLQRDYKDIDDIVRLGKARIRVPDQWYGDLLAQIGSCRVGERSLKALCDKYGVETLKEFEEKWQDYGRKRMIEEIRKLPKMTVEGETMADPVPRIHPSVEKGIPIRAKLSVYPDDGVIEVDLRDNIDSLPCGLNMSEACSKMSCVMSVLFNLDPTLPHNQGAFSRVQVKMREGGLVGIPKLGVGTSIATTNIADRLTNLIQSLFAKLGVPYGLAETAPGMGPIAAVVAGYDPRYDRDYITQLFNGPATGCCAAFNTDGYLTKPWPGGGGVLFIDSVEVEEQNLPILTEIREIATDSGGPGQWRGAPSCRVLIRPRFQSGTFMYAQDGRLNPAKGVLGGKSGLPARVWKVNRQTGLETELPAFSCEMITPDELIGNEANAGGGYGDPLDRDPESVRWDVREDWVSVEKARDIYGVVIDATTEQYTVNVKATKRLRAQMKAKRQKGG